MSWKFNPPPGWPQQPEGWVPPPGWTPDPSWPAAPPGWQFLVPAGSGQASGPPASGAPAAAAPGSPPGPAPVHGQPAAGQAPAGQPSYPTAPGQSGAAGQPAFAGAAPQYGAAGTPPPYRPAAGGGAARPWFGHWWTIVVLIVLLLLGTAVGFGSTRVVTEFDAAGSESTSDDPVAQPSATPEPGFALPTEVPVTPPAGGEEFSSLCGEVVVIMLPVLAANVAEQDDPDEYLDGVVRARSTAADELRDLEVDEREVQADVDTFADEIDGSVDMIEDDRGDIDTVNASFDRVGDAYTDFIEAHC